MLRAAFMTNALSGNALTPAESGYAMPAEWERHAATWLAWPHHEADWPGKMEAVRWVYGEMARKLAPGEQVRVLVRHGAEGKHAQDYFRRAGCDLKSVRFVVHPTNRSWLRDSGPIFVRRPLAALNEPREKLVAVADRRYRKAKTAIVHFHFNAWARHADWQKDRKVPELAAQFLRRPLFHAEVAGRPFVLEGGGIEVNGRGTLLTTEECYLHPKIQVRNPGLTRAQYDETFRKYLGVKNVFWLRKGTAGDDTHGHVDDVCRFVDRKTLVLIREKNQRDENYRRLAENWERIRDLRLEDGSRPEIVPLPMPGPLYFNGHRLPASYANFYIANACVMVPTFNDPNDRVALGILGELFRDRPVVGIHAVDLVLGSGSLHCLTQQQPE
jgi:agmatine deiminase